MELFGSLLKLSHQRWTTLLPRPLQLQLTHLNPITGVLITHTCHLCILTFHSPHSLCDLASRRTTTLTIPLQTGGSLYFWAALLPHVILPLVVVLNVCVLIFFLNLIFCAFPFGLYIF